MNFGIRYNMTPRVHELLVREGAGDFNFDLHWPGAAGIPAVGDEISWDWFADAQAFVIYRRRFSWENQTRLVVELWLDLPPDQTNT